MTHLKVEKREAQAGLWGQPHLRLWEEKEEAVKVAAREGFRR